MPSWMNSGKQDFGTSNCWGPCAMPGRSAPTCSPPRCWPAS